MKRSAMPRRRSSLRSSPPQQKGRGIKARNAKRRASEFERCYHSRERVAFVQSLPCIGCVGQRTYSVNAHIRGDGAGRKATYALIVPLCFSCHGWQHTVGVARFAAERHVDLEFEAARVEELWQSQLASPVGAATRSEE